MSTPVPSLVWLDLETTGLNENTDNVLEVACVVTDLAFEVQAIGEWLFHFDVEQTPPPTIDPFVRKMHHENGLWRDCKNATRGRTQEERRAIWREVEAFICAHNGQGSWLWGSGVGFERAWLRARAPEVLSLFKYRNGDVNTLYGLQGIVMDEDPNGPKSQPGDRQHRALADLEADISIARDWAGLLPLLASLQNGAKP